MTRLRSKQSLPSPTARLGAFLLVGIARGSGPFRVPSPPNFATGRTDQIPRVCAKVVLLVKDQMLTGGVSLFSPLFAQLSAFLHLHATSVARRPGLKTDLETCF